MKSKLLVLLLMLFFWGKIIKAQNTSRVEIENSDRAVFTVSEGISHFRGHCRFRHGDAVMYCDSADYFERINRLYAWGNVRIVQNDTINIKAKRLNYDGNNSRAELFENVSLSDSKAVLTTEYLIYSTKTRIGTYPNQGQIISGEDTLTSKIGHYYANPKEAFFKDSVHILSKKSEIFSDTLQYKTENQVATFFGPTNIISGDDLLYTELGWYDLKKELSESTRNSLYQSGSKLLKGDTIFYDKNKGLGKAVKNVFFIDTAEMVIMTGEYGEYQKPLDMGLVTKKALVRMIQDNDTTYLAADTLKTVMKWYPLTLNAVADSLQIDSCTAELPAVTDSIAHRIIFAYRNARLFKSDLQAVTDSLVFTYIDSTMRCYFNPVVWAEGSQMSAKTAEFEMKDKKIDKMRLLGSAFLVSAEADSTLFNQISGKNMVGFFRDNKLVRLNVLGNSESIYYPQEDSVTFTGLNYSVSSNMVISFKDSKLKSIRMDKDADGVLYPMDQIPANQDLLSGFVWYADERPLSPEDVYRHTKQARKEELSDEEENEEENDDEEEENEQM